MLISGICCALQVMAAGTGSITAGRWSLVLSGATKLLQGVSEEGGRIWASLDLIQSQMCLRKTPPAKKNQG